MAFEGLTARCSVELKLDEKERLGFQCNFKYPSLPSGPDHRWASIAKEKEDCRGDPLPPRDHSLKLNGDQFLARSVAVN